ncbi:MAG: choice-of-anchor J domain-containing protein [bacterium]
MRKFTLPILMVLLSTTIVFAQATSTRTTGAASTTPIIDKAKSAGSHSRADIYSIDFEAEIEWTFDFLPWTVVDVDQLPTYGFTNYTFPHMFEAMAYIVFNPETTDPPMTGDPEIQPHSGAQFGACMASVPSPPQGNDDWFMSDLVDIGTDSDGASFTFWAKSYTDAYGLERFNVAVSTTGNDPGDFSVISDPPYLEAPIVWTEYTFDLSAYAGQSIYVAIQCVSYDAFVFMIDDLVIDSGLIPQDCDHFDTYTAGELLCPQSGGLWTTWSNNPGGPDDGYVTDAEFLSPPNSLSIDESVLVSDLVYNLNQTTSGLWLISLDIMVPAGGTYGGYYNIMQDMTLFGVADEWGFQIYFASDGTGYMQDADFNETDFTYTVGEWTESDVIVDLDSSWAELWINGALINAWQWDIVGSNMLGVIDIYAAAPGTDDPKFYVDDVCFIQVPVGIDPVAANQPGIRLFPNPATTFLNITSPDQLLEVQIFNTFGQTVYAGKVSGNSLQINIQNFESGLYIVQVRSENRFETKKFMKQ